MFNTTRTDLALNVKPFDRCEGGTVKLAGCNSNTFATRPIARVRWATDSWAFELELCRRRAAVARERAARAWAAEKAQILRAGRD